MNVYIPTLGRVKRQITWRNLSPEARQNTFLVCVKEEAEALKQELRTDNVLVCPVRGIYRTWQWIHDREEDVFVIMDDDLRLARRVQYGDWKLLKCTDKDVNDMLFWVERKLRSGYVHAGISMRMHARHNKLRVGQNYGQRTCGLFGFNAPAIRSLGIKYAEAGTIGDFDFSLQLLCKGYANPASVDFYLDLGAPNAQGGASTDAEIRSLTRHNASVLCLKERYPAFVKVKTKNNWTGEFKNRLDVDVSWSSALTHSGVLHGDWSDPAFQQFWAKNARINTLLGVKRFVKVEWTGKKLLRTPFDPAVDSWVRPKTVLSMWTETI